MVRYRSFLRQTKSQATLELAVLGSLLILCSTVLLNYAQYFRLQQDGEMKAFRESLFLAGDLDDDDGARVNFSWQRNLPQIGFQNPFNTGEVSVGSSYYTSLGVGPEPEVKTVYLYNDGKESGGFFRPSDRPSDYEHVSIPVKEPYGRAVMLWDGFVEKEFINKHKDDEGYRLFAAIPFNDIFKNHDYNWLCDKELIIEDLPDDWPTECLDDEGDHWYYVRLMLYLDPIIGDVDMDRENEAYNFKNTQETKAEHTDNESLNLRNTQTVRLHLEYDLSKKTYDEYKLAMDKLKEWDYIDEKIGGDGEWWDEYFRQDEDGKKWNEGMAILEALEPPDEGMPRNPEKGTFQGQVFDDMDYEFVQHVDTAGTFDRSIDEHGQHHGSIKIAPRMSRFAYEDGSAHYIHRSRSLTTPKDNYEYLDQ